MSIEYIFNNWKDFKNKVIYTLCYGAALPARRCRPGLGPEDLGRIPEPDIGIFAGRGQQPAVGRERHVDEAADQGASQSTKVRPGTLA